MRNIVGKKVKEARILANRNLHRQLAIKLQMQDWSMDGVGIARIEAGIREVTDIEIVKLSKALGVTTSWLLGKKK